jgi:hypothetical protein
MCGMTDLTGTFVILHHTGHGPEHWDFMLEEAEALATWQCPVNPAVLSPGQAVPCSRLPDHRCAYLTYEGPVSGGRGEVRRVEEGSYQRLVANRQHRRVRLHGRKMTGLVELRKNETSDGWSLQRIAEKQTAEES